MATPASDMGVGLGLGLGAVCLAGALAMLVAGLAGQQLASGVGYAAAMLASALAVAAVHVYD